MLTGYEPSSFPPSQGTLHTGEGTRAQTTVLTHNSVSEASQWLDPYKDPAAPFTWREKSGALVLRLRLRLPVPLWLGGKGRVRKAP